MKRSVPLFLLLFVCNFLFSQTKFDFSGPVALSGMEGFPSSWKNIATITIDGVDYVLTAGGNGTWAKSTGGVGNSICLKKTGSGGDMVTIQRKDNEPFRFYGIWLNHSSLYNPPLGHPPYYTVMYNRVDGEPEYYPNYNSATTASETINHEVVVYSVTLTFSSILYYFSIDDLIVGPTSTEIEPLSVTAAQANVSCAGGHDGSAMVSVTGGRAPYSYYWTGVESDGPTATGLAAGTYTCTISDGSENSFTQRFYIDQPETSTISISSQPLSKTISNGQSAIFSVTASGVTSYQWQVDRGEGFENVINEYPYSGVNSSTLSIESEVSNHSGWKYRCMLSNSCSEPATSNTATLLVKSDNASLESLFITPGELNREFSGEITEYSAQVSPATSELNISAFAYPGATVKINGTPFVDRSLSIPLEGGSNEIKVEVTAENGTTKKIYYLNVNRPLAKVLSIERANNQVTNAETVTYIVKLSTPVTGLSAGHFSFQVDGTLFLYSVESVSKTSETTYNVTVNTGTGDGQLNLSLSSIEGLDVPFQGIPFTGEDGYIIDKTAPQAKGKNISVTLGSSGLATISPYSLNDGSTDNYTSELILSASKTEFSAEDLGQRTVMLTAKDQAGNSSSVEVTVTVNRDVAYLTPIEPIYLVYGNALNLPEEVNVVFSDNSRAALPVKWNTETYTGRVGEYSVTGNIALPEFVTNSESLHYETGVVVTRKQLSVAFEGRVSKVYDGNRTAFIDPEFYVLSGIVKEDDVHLNNPETGTYDTKNAGAEKKITISELALTGEDASNYFIESSVLVTFSGKIIAKDLTVQMNEELSIDKVYDGNTNAAIDDENVIIEGAIKGDDISIEAIGTYSNKNAGENKTITVAEFSVTGEDKANYRLLTTNATTHGTIKQKESNVSLNEGTISKVYDGSAKAILAAEKLMLDEKVKGDDLNIEAEAYYDNKNAGSEKTVTINSFQLNGEDKNNYRLTTEQLTAYGSIFQKEISLELNAEPAITKVYDASSGATLTAENYSLQDVAKGDELLVSGQAFYSDKNVGNGKPVTVNEFALQGEDKGNYLLTTREVSTQGSITPKELHVELVSATGITKIYDGTDEATIGSANYEVTGTIKKDDIGINNPATGRFDDKHAGSNKMVYVDDLLTTGADANNYIIASPSISAPIGTVVQRDVTINIESKTKVYGSADPALTYEVPGIIKGEELQGKLARKEGDDAGEYFINPGTVNGGKDYNITHFEAGKLTITPADLTIVADSKTKDQGKANPAFTFTYSGFVHGDNANDLQVTPVANTVASAVSPIGYYDITPSAAVSNNYHIKFVKGTLTILPNTHGNSLKVWRTGAGIQVRVFVKEDQKSYVMMVTSVGQAIMVEQKMLKAGFNNFTLPLTHLASSNYVITVGSDKFKLAQRIDIK
jgi:hypothetical protein